MFSVSFVAAQTKKDTIREVIIRDAKTSKINSTQEIDSSVTLHYQNTSLQNVLQLHSNVFVKNYGIGALSTISIRGSSAAQTSVMWNGLNINNAMTGISDFSVLPVSFFDDIKINYSNASSNSVSGSIELSNNKPNFSKHNEVNFGAGYESLDNSAIYASLLHSSSRLSLRVKGFAQQSKNTFSYFNPERDSIVALEHAQSKSHSILSDLDIRITSKQMLSAHFWAQRAQREIPPAAFEVQSAKNEINESIRSLLNYEMRFRTWSSNTSIGAIHDKLNYEDSLINLKNNSESISIPFSEAIHLYPSSLQKISIIYAYNYATLLTGNKENLQRTSIHIGYDIEPRYRKLYIKSFIQKEFTNVFTLPLIAGVNLKRRLNNEHFLLGTISSNYRTPTLNELYFAPGGNLNLKPETSRNLEGGLENSFKNKNHLLKINTTIFTRNVKNWIVWYGGSILTPHNIQRVWSRGLEFDLNYRYIIKTEPPLENYVEEILVANSNSKRHYEKETSIYFKSLYSYTLSTTEESAIANDYSLGKQIPYVPRYQVKINLGYTKNQFDINYVYAYTGYRFVTTDESAYLLPYNTHNIFTSWKTHIHKNQEILVNFKVNNILNKSYESIIGRFMPGRNYSFGLNFRLRK